MPRTIDDLVMVRTRRDQSQPDGPRSPWGEAGTGDSGVPDQFIWRDRLYVVRSVIEHWRQRQAWWARPTALAIHGEAEAEPLSPSTATELAAAADREVWRVSAVTGRREAGVFELCADGAGPDRAWRLLRVDD